ncbi:MAG: tRNA-dihydrouridine synthase family protein [Desulfuromonadales bacterium]|nr:tRNA-dihydrouridine synthase family protein [Desulfuromonadales bacterium]
MPANQFIPANADTLRTLPWEEGATPLMLAPLQGLTNRAMRALFIDWVHPDVVFTEFMRVSNVSRKRLARNDLKEAASTSGAVPLVAQLVGSSSKALVAAARKAEATGARHINLNMGCPYGRMTTGATGGAMLQHPELLAEVIPAMRQAISGSFSIKLRAGYDDPEQIFSLLPLFEAAEVDFLVLHPRTVAERYAGSADHSITARVIRETSLPVIANGDIRTAGDGLRILEETGAAGLMLGRGAIADPLLFERLRNRSVKEPTAAESTDMLHRYLQDLLVRYSKLFCGERQILDKIKNVVDFIVNPAFSKQVGKMKRAKNIETLAALIDAIK